MKNIIHTNYPILEDSTDYEEIKVQCEKLEGQKVLWILPWNKISLNEPESFNEAYLAHLKTIFSIADQFRIEILLTPEINLFSLPSWVLHELTTLEAKNGLTKLECYYLSLNETGQNCLFSFFLALFFAGNILFPEIKKDGELLKDFFQENCISAMKHCARRLKKATNVLGFYFSKILDPDFVYSHLKTIDSLSLNDTKIALKEKLPIETLKTQIDSFKLSFASAFEKKHAQYVFITE